MKLTFRWYGPKDCIPLSYIKQIPGMTGVVTAVYDVPVGEVWECDKIAALKAMCDKHGLEMEVIESVPCTRILNWANPQGTDLLPTTRKISATSANTG